MAKPSITKNKIIYTSLRVFMAQGIKKTFVEEIALQAGLTRTTIYRYFPDKTGLVQAAFMLVPVRLLAVLQDIKQDTSCDVEKCLDRVVECLALLPRGDLPARMEELHQLYPELWLEFQQARREAVGSIFSHMLRTAEKQNRLRPGINPQVLSAYFSNAVINVMQDPALVSPELPAEEVVSTVKAIFLHGILKKKPGK